MLGEHSSRKDQRGQSWQMSSVSQRASMSAGWFDRETELKESVRAPIISEEDRKRHCQNLFLPISLDEPGVPMMWQGDSALSHMSDVLALVICPCKVWSSSTCLHYSRSNQ